MWYGKSRPESLDLKASTKTPQYYTEIDNDNLFYSSWLDLNPDLVSRCI